MLDDVLKRAREAVAHAVSVNGGGFASTINREDLKTLIEAVDLPTPPEMADARAYSALETVAADHHDRFAMLVSAEIKQWADTRWPKNHGVGTRSWVDGLTRRVLVVLAGRQS